ncbi:hypothetical protein A7456_06975 [Moraxella nonliquefaciens]|jgi:hypothetical protein|uniref:Uncharacterized protein n=1 Tax=Moraxella nonliquefaciens TaxID=478 RepID=A0A1B8QHC6_MORNO|nr:hypothetical protein A7456_06975 [Moraxella nonliquefaciens]
MSRIIDVITLLLLVINFYYMISLGIFGFFLYLKLLIDIFFKKIDKINQRKLINVLSCISVFPSISLFLFLLFDFFDDHDSLFVHAIRFRNIQDAFYGMSFIMLWFMPAIFLLLRNYINNSRFYIKFSLIWYGIIMVCLAFHIYGARMHIFKLFLKN